MYTELCCTLRKQPKASNCVVGFGVWFRATFPFIPATVISGPLLRKIFLNSGSPFAVCLYLLLRVALTPLSGYPVGTLPHGGPTQAATCLSTGAVATNLYMGLVNEPSDSSPESHSPAQPGGPSRSQTSVGFHLGLDG